MQTITYAGYYANASGNLSRPKVAAGDDEDVSHSSKATRYIPWAKLLFKSWSVDPELCPRCGEQMDRKKPITKKTELETLLKRLGQWGYPTRPPTSPISAMSHESSSSSDVAEKSSNVVQLFPVDDINQCPPGWTVTT